MGHTLINTLTHLVCALQRTSTHPQLSEPSPKQMPPSNYGSLRVAAPFLPFTKIYEICFTTNCRGSLSETARSLGSHAVRQIVCVCVPGVCACVARSQVGGGEHGPQEPVIGSSRTRMSSELKLRVQTSFSYYVRYKGKRQRQNQQFPGLGQVNRPRDHLTFRKNTHRTIDLFLLTPPCAGAGASSIFQLFIAGDVKDVTVIVLK